MKMPSINVRGLFNSGMAMVRAHSAEIMIGFGITGFLSAMVMMVPAVQNAEQHIQEATEEKGEPLSKTEVVKAAWKDFLLPVGTAVSATVCTIGAIRLENRKIAAAATLAQMYESQNLDLKNKMGEVLGERKAVGIAEESAADKVKNLSVSEEGCIHTRYGEDIFYDPWSHRFFTSSKDKIRLAFSELTNELDNPVNYLADGSSFVGMNELYYKLGLDGTYLSSEFGWTNKSSERPRIDWAYGPTKDGHSCCILVYDVVLPQYRRKFEGTDFIV